MGAPLTALIRIEAPHFVAAVEVRYDPRRSPPGRIVVAGAPILSYMRGWSEDHVFTYCASKHWIAQVLNNDGESDSV